MPTITIASTDQLEKAAEEFLMAAGEAAVITFSGELGAGKTTFIQAMCRVLGVPVEVNSPTFSLVNEYYTREGKSLYHMDLYRIEDPEELFDLGYEEYLFSGNRCFIEWPEKAPGLIPDDALMAHITVLGDGKRTIEF